MSGCVSAERGKRQSTRGGRGGRFQQSNGRIHQGALYTMYCALRAAGAVHKNMSFDSLDSVSLDAIFFRVIGLAGCNRHAVHLAHHTVRRADCHTTASVSVFGKWNGVRESSREVLNGVKGDLINAADVPCRPGLSHALKFAQQLRMGARAGEVARERVGLL